MLIGFFSLGRTAEALRAIIGSKSALSLQRGPVDPKFQVEWVAPTNHSSQNTRLNYLSHCIKIWTDFSSVLPQCTRLKEKKTDGQTDRRTEISSQDRVCIPCSAVKRVNFLRHSAFYAEMFKPLNERHCINIMRKLCFLIGIIASKQ